jgi:DNA-binding NarL/FixJ family response regulator
VQDSSNGTADNHSASNSSLNQKFEDFLQRIADIPQNSSGGTVQIIAKARTARGVFHLVFISNTPDFTQGLTEREIEVCLQLPQGRKNSEIAYDLHISRPTVAAHLRNIYRKLGVHNRSSVVAKLTRAMNTKNEQEA